MEWSVYARAYGLIRILLEALRRQRRSKKHRIWADNLKFRAYLGPSWSTLVSLFGSCSVKIFLIRQFLYQVLATVISTMDRDRGEYAFFESK